MTTDLAYVCSGSCMAARVRMQLCDDPLCDRHGKPFEKVPVVYECPLSTCTSCSIAPSLCHRYDCLCNGKLLHARAVVPPKYQQPILDPPEERRTYSSVMCNEAMGTGNASSCISSPQGWTSGMNDTYQWVMIDAGSVVESIGGLALSNLSDSRNKHVVTKVAVDVANRRDGPWHAVDAGRIIDTNIVEKTNFSYSVVRFLNSVKTRYVRIRPVEWKGGQISLRCALLLSGKAEDEFHEKGNYLEYRLIHDVSQLPANVPVTRIPGGQATPCLPPNHGMSSSIDFNISQIPTGRCEWAGRKMSWDVVKFNDRDNKRGNRIFAVTPNQPCSITVRYRAYWRFNGKDRYSGSMVQLYYGMESCFCTGVVRNGIRDNRGESTTKFVAPKEPGLYYVTQSISLMGDFVENIHRHHNEPSNSIAVIRVLPQELDETTYISLPPLLKRQMLCMMAFSRRQGEHSNVFSKLGHDALFQILSYLPGQDPDENANFA